MIDKMGCPYSVVDLKDNNWIENLFNHVDDHFQWSALWREKMVSYVIKIDQLETFTKFN